MNTNKILRRLNESRRQVNESLTGMYDDVLQEIARQLNDMVTDPDPEGFLDALPKVSIRGPHYELHKAQDLAYYLMNRGNYHKHLPIEIAEVAKDALPFLQGAAKTSAESCIGYSNLKESRKRAFRSSNKLNENKLKLHTRSRRRIIESLTKIPEPVLEEIAYNLNLEIEGAPVDRDYLLRGLSGIYLRKDNLDFLRLQADIEYILDRGGYDHPLNRDIEDLVEDILPYLTGNAKGSAKDYLSKANSTKYNP